MSLCLCRWIALIVYTKTMSFTTFLPTLLFNLDIISLFRNTNSFRQVGVFTLTKRFPLLMETTEVTWERLFPTASSQIWHTVVSASFFSIPNSPIKPVSSSPIQAGCFHLSLITKTSFFNR